MAKPFSANAAGPFTGMSQGQPDGTMSSLLAAITGQQQAQQFGQQQQINQQTIQQNAQTIGNYPEEHQLEIQKLKNDISTQEQAAKNNFSSTMYPWAKGVDPKLTFPNTSQGHVDFTDALLAAYPEDGPIVERLRQDMGNPKTRSKALADIKSAIQQDPDRGKRISYELAAQLKDPILGSYVQQSINERNNDTKISINNALNASREKIATERKALLLQLGRSKIAGAQQMFLAKESRLASDFQAEYQLKQNAMNFKEWLQQAKIKVDYDKMSIDEQKLLEKEFADTYNLQVKEFSAQEQAQKEQVNQTPNQAPTININIPGVGTAPTPPEPYKGAKVKLTMDDQRKVLAKIKAMPKQKDAILKALQDNGKDTSFIK